MLVSVSISLTTFIKYILLLFYVMKVLTFGTFDVFHPGHVHYLKTSKTYGDELYVLVARDQTVEKIKGKVPRNSEDKRLEIVKNQDFVDDAFLGNKSNFYEVLDKVKPEVICLGYDQMDFIVDLEEELSKRNLESEIVRISSHKPEIYKSSKMIC